MDKKKAQATSTEDSLTATYLQQIANCLAYLIINTDKLKGKYNCDLIPILASLGFDRSAIASILQTTPETVSVRLSQLKAEVKGKKTSMTNLEVNTPDNTD